MRAKLTLNLPIKITETASGWFMPSILYAHKVSRS